MGDTAIEWTDKTWNPVVGCTKVSAGCKACYAKTLHDLRHKAHQANKRMPLQYAQPFEVVQLMPDRLSDPLSWRKPQRVFVNSVSDLFHEDIPDAFIRRVFGVMSLCGQHTFQVLTKRPERMAAFFASQENSLSACQAEEVVSRPEPDASLTPSGRSRIRNLSAINGTHGLRVGEGNYWPLPNVWLGTSVENQAAADERIPHLLKVPAAVRFLSCEPLLGPVDLTKVWLGDKSGYWNALTGKLTCRIKLDAGGEAWAETEDAITGRISWVICGGESGANARPMHPDWARSLRDQCQAAGVAFFFKQWGEWSPAWAWARAENVDPVSGHHEYPRMGPKGLPVQGDNTMFRVGKKAAGRTLDGRTHDEFPQAKGVRS